MFKNLRLQNHGIPKRRENPQTDKVAEKTGKKGDRHKFAAVTFY